jgi:hypothetical protein
MIKKAMLSALVLATLAGSTLPTVSQAQAQQYDNSQWRHHNDRYDPPPPDRHHHHHNNNGAVIAGGIAAGVIGGILGGAIANGNAGYAPPPPPPPECWFERRAVQNEYDDGWHYERMRVCN